MSEQLPADDRPSMTIDFKFALMQPVKILGLGGNGIVRICRVAPGDTRDYYVSYWHDGKLFQEWLYESELEALPASNP